MPSDVMRAKSMLGVAVQRGTPEQIATARRDLAAANIAAFVDKALATAPPLTPEQAARITSKLRPSAGGAA